jgi:hypothetical protein
MQCSLREGLNPLTPTLGIFIGEQPKAGNPVNFSSDKRECGQQRASLAQPYISSNGLAELFLYLTI